MIKRIFCLIFFVSLVLLLGLAVKGDKSATGTGIAYQTGHNTQVSGPYEASNSTSRYALTEALVDNHTIFLNDELAAFASPDLVQFNGKYFTIFTPGVSVIAAPFYALGKVVGFPQLFAYFTINLFAIFNVFLIARVAYRLGASFYTSLLSGFLFLFATNALPYSMTFTQHHMSVTFILLMVLNSIEKRSFLRNIMFGVLFGVGILLDIPNIFLAFPLVIYVTWKHFELHHIGEKIKFSLSLSVIGLAIGLLPMVALFGYYNYLTTHSFTMLGQTIGRADAFQSDLAKQIDAAEQRREEQQNVDKNQKESSVASPFSTRRQLLGLYLLLISDERGWFYYSPVVIIGLIGLWLAFRQKETQPLAVNLIAIILVDLMTYSMFSDPWGGWAFGPRYLIPATAVACAGIGKAVTHFRRDFLVLAAFIILAAYSVYVNGLGVMTTNSIPPKVEAESLNKPIPFTYTYNIGLVEQGTSSSLIYHLFAAKYMNVQEYLNFFYGVTGVIALGLLALIIYEHTNV